MQRTFWALLPYLGAAALLAGCPSSPDGCPTLVVEPDQSCEIAKDCVDANYPDLSCVNGQCRRPCARDADCALRVNPMCTGMPQGPAYCEDQVCQGGCATEADCGSGETCFNSRCVLYAEGFEAPDGAPSTSFIQLGWNGIETELENQTTKLAFVGVSGCTIGDERCAGDASEGERFAAVGTTQTPERGTAETTVTCRSCACCLQCINMQANGIGPGVEVSVPDCPNPAVNLPTIRECVNPPPTCANVCAECDACPAGDAFALGDGLLACEERAAAKTCGVCPLCQASACEDCRTTTCATQCAQPDSPACLRCQESSCPACGNCLFCAQCEECRQDPARCQTACRDDPDSPQCQTCVTSMCPAPCSSCRTCSVCAQATSCAISDPGSASCIQKRSECDAQGAQGCYDTARNYTRAQLEDLEQALISPPIASLTGVGGVVVFQFDQVPFNVGLTYRRGIQNASPETWPIDPQQVKVQFCGANCELDASWSDGQLVTGEPAIFPPATQRFNGLSLGSQSAVDWTSGRVQIAVPMDVRTGEFRFRFLPQLGDGVRVGIDNIQIRSVQ